LFGMTDARDAASRMGALERFLEFWYGPNRPEFGEPKDRLDASPLPYPLRRFYGSAGRQPPLRNDGNDYFYQGGSGHHLLDLDGIELLPDGRLNFFTEYQGDWNGLTLPDAEDPPVWLKGCFEEDDVGEEDEEGERTVRVGDSLSAFLVAHCLMATLYESENHVGSAWAKTGDPLHDYLGTKRASASPLWDARGLAWPRSCLDYGGSFRLVPDDGILVHQTDDAFRFVARDARGARILEEASRGR